MGKSILMSKRFVDQEKSIREAAINRSLGASMDDVMDVLDSEPVVVRSVAKRSDPFPDGFSIPEPVDKPVNEDTPKVLSGYEKLQFELQDVRECRARISHEMENPDLDKDDRESLKMRAAVLDARERSAREELKLFHQNALRNSGQVKKIRIQIEDYFSGEIPSVVQGEL